MINITDKLDCCGCTACKNKCPKNAIEMRPDEEGFIYPYIDREKCIECGLCDKVCPILNPIRVGEGTTKGYIVRNKDLNIVRDSTSGGAFSVFANEIFARSGVVYGAGYDDDMNVVCKKATDMDEAAQMRGSKFVQSDLKSAYSEIRDLLNDKIPVMFTGTPCQVAGLLSFLGSAPDHLICVDFVCRGVPSPKLWRNYTDMMQSRYRAKIVEAKFKNKTYGYHATTMKVTFANGKTWYGSGRVDPMMKAFVSEMASRPSCGECRFKGIRRPGDITMFDCYEFAAITGKCDDDLGYTSLFVHSKKGRELFEAVKDRLVSMEVSVDDLVTENGVMVCNSAKPSAKRSEFFKAANEMPIDEAMNKVSPITRKDYMLERLKRVFYRLGLIPLLKKIKNEKVAVNNR